MWLLIATVCATADLNTCTTLVWEAEAFITEEKCLEAGAGLLPLLVPNNLYVNGTCYMIPNSAMS